MYKTHTLKNGLKLIVSPLPGTKSVTVLCLAGAGSRYEHKEIGGISHFLEHLFFKGGNRYKNAAEVSSAIDSVGGDFNAFTGKEYAGYYVKLASHQKEVAFDVIGDMMINATLKQEEIDKEKGVILEEYNMYQDTPMYQVSWNFEKLLFGDQPLGWDQLGEPEVIKSLNHDEIMAYRKALYTSDNVILSVSGDINDSDAIELAEKYFIFDENKKSSIKYNAYIANNSSGNVTLKNKKTEQAHIILGVEALPARDKLSYTEKILAVILGGNMSSRMFLNVRESKGLSYYIRTTTDDYLDTGIISTSAGVDVSRIDLAITAILEEYRKITEEEVSPEELKKAKEFMKGKIILHLEDSEEYAHMLGRQALLYSDIDTLEDTLKKIDAVTSKDILELSRNLFKEENLKLAIIGPYSEEEHFKNLLHY